MVYNNGFGVKILSSKSIDKLSRDGDNYIALDNNTEYSLYLTNDRSTDCMAEVHIDGEYMGTWLINRNSSITIDRPVNVARKFTFMKETDYRASRAGVVSGASLNGVVKVKFTPKRNVHYYSSPRTVFPVSPRSMRKSLAPMSSTSSMSSAPTSFSQMPSFSASRSSSLSSATSYSSGATILGSNSSQEFTSASRFADHEIDYDNVTEIILRLVVKSEHWYRTPIDEPYIPLSSNRRPSSPRVPRRIDYSGPVAY